MKKLLFLLLIFASCKTIKYTPETKLPQSFEEAEAWFDEMHARKIDLK